MTTPPSQLVAVDVGNSQAKLGLFDCRHSDDVVLPEPASTITIANENTVSERLGNWLAGLEPGTLSWSIGSVNRPAATRLIDWLCRHRSDEPITLLAAGDLLLEVRLDRPDMVGIDRLLDAVAANRLRRPGHQAVLVDVGSAITVDLVSPEGEFLGGAILPGLAMSARALHTFTDLLPEVEIAELETPLPPLGTATVPAIQSGLFWGAVGAVRELIARLTADRSAPVDVFLTGGAGPAVAELIGDAARHVPHLTLQGIAVAGKGLGIRSQE